MRQINLRLETHSSKLIKNPPFNYTHVTCSFEDYIAHRRACVCSQRHSSEEIASLKMCFFFLHQNTLHVAVKKSVTKRELTSVLEVVKHTRLDIV